MLGIMRKYKESMIIKVVFVVIVASFIGTIFLVWGKGGGGPSGGKSYAAKVDGRTITLEEYQQSYYRLRNVYEQLLGKSMTPDVEKSMGIKKQALDNLIDQYIIAKAASKMDISISKDEISAAIAANPSFQKDGAFDFSMYQKILTSNRITPKDYEENQKQELMIKKARKQISDKAAVSDDEAKSFYHKKNDKVSLTVATFNPSDITKEIKLSDQELTAYLQANEQKFKTVEKISIQYSIFDPSSLAGKTSVTEDDIQSFYQKNIDKYQGNGGILPLADVKDKAKADTIKFKAGKAGYEMVADAMNKNLSANDIAKAASSLGLKVLETPQFSAVQPDSKLASETEVIKKAFMLKSGEMGGPIETSKGIYLLKVKERIPPAVPPLASIKGQVEAAAKVDKAKELAKKRAEDAVAAISKGGALPAGGQTTPVFGYSENGNLPLFGVSKEAMDAAFTLTAAAPAAKSALKVGEKWFVLKLNSRIEADKVEFEKQKETIKKELLPKKQQEALENWVKELKAKAKIDINETLIAN